MSVVADRNLYPRVLRVGTSSSFSYTLSLIQNQSAYISVGFVHACVHISHATCILPDKLCR
jgi:hypothetical protein